MTFITHIPPPPPPPPCRVVVDYGPFGSLYFNSKDEMKEYFAESWWRKLFCITKYHKRIDDQMMKLR